MSSEVDTNPAPTYDLPPGFSWSSDYDALLEQIATTDVVDYEWTKLRDIIKYKIKQSTQDFLDAPLPPPPPEFSLEPSTPAGLRIAPLPPKKRDLLTSLPVPVNRMNEAETKEMLEGIFELLHGFDEGHPPFTIQRLCELCLRPTEHYNVSGKYLRAVEKALLVTSSTEAFPPLPPQLPFQDGIGGFLSSESGSAPPTPVFSPLKFLHRSPSPSPRPLEPTSPSSLSEGIPAHVDPLSLNVIDSVGMDTAANSSHTQEGPSLGLVDELDDPRPGHMSDRPTAISSVTTVGENVDSLEGSSGSESASEREPKGRGFIDTLETRFVSSGSQ